MVLLKWRVKDLLSALGEKELAIRRRHLKTGIDGVFVLLPLCTILWFFFWGKEPLHLLLKLKITQVQITQNGLWVYYVANSWIQKDLNWIFYSEAQVLAIVCVEVLYMALFFPKLKAKKENKFLNTANFKFWLWSYWILPEPFFGSAFCWRRGKRRTSIEAHTECGEANKD